MKSKQPLRSKGHRQVPVPEVIGPQPIKVGFSSIKVPIIIAIIGLVVVTFAVFGNGLVNGLVFDDQFHVLSNPLLRSLRNIPAILKDYRPLRDVTYAIDFAIWGDSPFGFHFTNLLLHAINVVLVFFLIKRLTGKLEIGIIAALVFAVHPIQTDAVTYVSGRRDVLFAVFYIPAFMCYLRFHENRRKKYIIFFFIFWLLSLLSKEMAASLPALIFAWSFCELWEPEGGRLRSLAQAVWKALKKDRWLYGALVLVTIPYAYYQVYIEGGSQRAGHYGLQYWGGNIFTNFLTEIRVQAWFLKQLVFPTPIAQYQGAFPVATTIFDLHIIIALIVVGLVFVAGLIVISRSRMASFAILSYFALLLPVSQIIPHHELLADHYLYLPMMSFGLLIGLGVQKLVEYREAWRRSVYAATGALLIVFAVLTVIRNTTWKDQLVFWKTNYQAVPNSPRAVYSLAVQYISLNPQKAFELFRECLQLDPTNVGAYTDIALLVNNREDANTVKEIVLKGLGLPDGQIIASYQNPQVFRSSLTAAQAVVTNALGDHRGSGELLQRAVNIYPANPQVYDLLYSFYEKDANKQMDVLKQELKYLPNNKEALDKIIYLYIKRNDYDGAIPYIDRSLRINPNDVFANYQLGRIYITRRDCDNARRCLRRAASAASSPDDVTATKTAIADLAKICGS